MATSATKVATFEVLGGTGLRVIARGKTHKEAERIRDEFDRKIARAGLSVPPSRIKEER